MGREECVYECDVACENMPHADLTDGYKWGKGEGQGLTDKSTFRRLSLFSIIKSHSSLRFASIRLSLLSSPNKKILAILTF